MTGVVLIALLAACGPSGAAQTPSFTPTAAPTPRGPDLPADTPPTPSMPIADIPPSITEAVIEEAARVSGVPFEDVSVVRAEAVVWNDGSLGCPQPDEMYTQALVEGYWVVVDAGGQEYDFRVGSNGDLRLCPAGS